MATGTVRLHRVLRTKPEKVYRAFLEADAIAKWIPPYGLTCTVQQGIPEMIPVEMCYLGWQESLLQLAKLVEPDIP
ncbi:MAG: hypothetical protein OEV69_00300 [Gammaproteobacteria bacterium]|nr:hypothetical protein [Gammaproteobacteria bacterium]MDH5320955.1 hypothetical protein [Gammaproteobacteria bacterium]